MFKFLILIVFVTSSEAFEIMDVTASPPTQVEGGSIILRCIPFSFSASGISGLFFVYFSVF